MNNGNLKTSLITCVCVFLIYIKEWGCNEKWRWSQTLLDIWFYSNFSFNLLFSASYSLSFFAFFLIVYCFFLLQYLSTLFHFISLLWVLNFSHFPQNQLFLPFSGFSFFNIHLLFCHHLPSSYNFIASLSLTYIQLLFYQAPFTFLSVLFSVSLCL